jgi:hypothetical protein
VTGRGRDGNHTPQNYNSIEDSVGNEENVYLALDPNKTMINLIKETWLTRMYKMNSRNLKTPKIKNMRRHRNK